MAAAKFKVSDIAKKMGKSEKDVIFQLQSLGAEITDPNQALEPEVIQALITGKKLTMRTRSVIMREDKPQIAAKKEAVRPPRAIVKPTPRPKREVPADQEPQVAAPPPTVIIPEFVEAVEAKERAAKEAPPVPEKPAAKPRPVVVETPAPEPAPAPMPPPAAAPQAPAPMAAAGVDMRRPTGPTGPRARAPQAARPNYAGQAPVARPTYVGGQTARPAGPGTSRPPMGGTRPSGPPGSRPPMGTRPSGPGVRPGGPMGARPAGPGNFRPGVGRTGGTGPSAPPPLPGTLPGGAMGRSKSRRPDGSEDSSPKKKTTGKRGKSERPSEVDNELFTKGPFSGTQIINDDLGPDIPMPETDEDGAPKAPSNRRDVRKQAAPVSGKVLNFTRPTNKIPLSEGATVKELADKLGIKANDLMKHLLMKKGLMLSINQPLGGDLALEIAKDLGIDAEIVSFEEAVELEAMEKTGATGSTPRGPVITVMGHVDHGKTSLLDAIRETNVAGGEAGGITQHIGAYHVEKRGRKIVFLDTPGHEAFTMMRARGAKVTDIVILVVAADDGVMPQTKEAIDHARAAKVPMIVAINKIDKPNANVDRVRRELAENGVQVEQWGGDVVSVEVSALKKQGIDDLLDMILLTADILDLKSAPEMPARGVVLEAQKEVGRGIVATVLVQDGTLKIGDSFFSGHTWGRVRAMSDERGERVKDA